MQKPDMHGKHSFARHRRCRTLFPLDGADFPKVEETGSLQRPAFSCF